MFIQGMEGYQCFRIPAIVAAKDRLLAFSEGRKRSCDDFGNNDLVMRVSDNGGMTWSELRVLVDYDSLQASNAAPVFDQYDPEGRLYLFYNTGNVTEHEIRMGKGLREVWYISSEDLGETWSEPVNITAQVHFPQRYADGKENPLSRDWRGYANTPGHAVQVDRGKYQGRIFVPANHTEGDPKADWSDCFAHGFYTDDHGRSFQVSPNISLAGSNEATAAVLRDGGILLNARNQKGTPRQRVVGRSSTAGSSWDTVYYDPQLIEPVCQASMINARFHGRDILLFANPASETRRKQLTLRASLDDGFTWPLSLLVIEGDAAYCDLVFLPPDQVGILYEKGNEGGIYYRSVRLGALIKE